MAAQPASSGFFSGLFGFVSRTFGAPTNIGAANGGRGRPESVFLTASPSSWVLGPHVADETAGQPTPMTTSTPGGPNTSCASQALLSPPPATCASSHSTQPSSDVGIARPRPSPLRPLLLEQGGRAQGLDMSKEKALMLIRRKAFRSRKIPGQFRSPTPEPVPQPLAAITEAEPASPTKRRRLSKAGKFLPIDGVAANLQASTSGTIAVPSVALKQKPPTARFPRVAEVLSSLTPTDVLAQMSHSASERVLQDGLTTKEKIEKLQMELAVLKSQLAGVDEAPRQPIKRPVSDIYAYAPLQPPPAPPPKDWVKPLRATPKSANPELENEAFFAQTKTTGSFLVEARSRLKQTPPKPGTATSPERVAAVPVPDMDKFLEELKHARLRRANSTGRASSQGQDASTPATSIAEASTPGLSLDDSSLSADPGRPETPSAEEDIVRQAHAAAFAGIAAKAKVMRSKRLPGTVDGLPSPPIRLANPPTDRDNSRGRDIQKAASALLSRRPSSPMPPVWVKPRPKGPGRQVTTSTPRDGSPAVSLGTPTHLIDDEDPLNLSYSPPPQRVVRSRPQRQRLSQELARAVQRSARVDPTRHTRNRAIDVAERSTGSKHKSVAARKKAILVDSDSADEADAEYEPDLLSAVGTRDPQEIGFIRNDGTQLPAPSFCTWGAGLY